MDRVTSYHVRILGKLWMPGVTAASEFTFRPGTGPFEEEADTENDFDANLRRHGGDFSAILDFEVTAIGTVACSHGSHPTSEIVRPWEKGEESEFAWADCMYPAEGD